MKVLCISETSSLNVDNEDTINTLLKATNAEIEKIELDKYDITPCQRCLKCVGNNECVIKDDGIELCNKAKDADALIITGITPYSVSLPNVETFIERLFCLRHAHGFMMGKPCAFVITTCIKTPNKKLIPSTMQTIKDIRGFLNQEGLHLIGAVNTYKSEPCSKCHHKEYCDTSVDVNRHLIKKSQCKTPNNIQSATDIGNNLRRALI